MPSVLDKYQLVKTLGKGGHAKVKLGINTDSGEKYAIKIFKKSGPAFDEKALVLLSNEVKIMQSLNHPHLVNIIDYNDNGTKQKLKGKEEKVVYIVLELATGGELFEYVATGGRFEETVARYYFHQLIEGLEYLHSNGTSHRDLKPENILLDENFHIKIADFGYAAPLSGHDGSGKHKTYLGTESYMAPEILLRQPYSGTSVDLFAAGIILFILVTQHPPFSKAHPTDPYFNLILSNRLEYFWARHSANKPGKDKFFSQEFKTLLSSMFSFNPTHRPTIAEIKAHPWFNGPVASHEEVVHDFNARKQKIDFQAEQERIKREARRKQQHDNRGPFVSTLFNAPKVFRSVPGEVEEEGTEEHMTSLLLKGGKRELNEYQRYIKKVTEFFSTSNPDILLNQLAEYAKNKAIDFVVSEDTYKVKMGIITETERVELKAEISLAKEGVYAVEFIKQKGSLMQFMAVFNEIKEFFQEHIDATY